MAPCCVCNCPNSSLISCSFHRVLNFVLHVAVLPSSTPLVILCTILSSHEVNTIQLVNVVSNVSTRSGFSFNMSESPNSNNWICDNEAAVSLSCEHSVDTVTGASFHALRISHSVFAAPTQLPVMRSCQTVSGAPLLSLRVVVAVQRRHRLAKLPELQLAAKLVIPDIPKVAGTTNYIPRSM